MFFLSDRDPATKSLKVIIGTLWLCQSSLFSRTGRLGGIEAEKGARFGFLLDSSLLVVLGLGQYYKKSRSLPILDRRQLLVAGPR